MRKPTKATAGVISTMVRVDLLDPIEVISTMDAELRYDTREPLAVTMRFLAPTGDVVWMFSRELLAGGLIEPTGDGDVHVWPSYDHNNEPVTVMELSSPDGSALVQIAESSVLSFFDETALLVPLGAERVDTQIDETIAAILATGRV